MHTRYNNNSRFVCNVYFLFAETPEPPDSSALGVASALYNLLCMSALCRMVVGRVRLASLMRFVAFLLGLRDVS